MNLSICEDRDTQSGLGEDTQPQIDVDRRIPPSREVLPVRVYVHLSCLLLALAGQIHSHKESSLLFIPLGGASTERTNKSKEERERLLDGVTASSTRGHQL